MGDTVEEEFDPLFDYRRVQPCNVICLDDDSFDRRRIGCRKKQKLADTSVEKKDKNQDAINVINLEDEDEDWLPPPPKVTTDSTLFKEDSIIKKLRLQKQELKEFAESATDVLQEIEETVRKDLAAADHLNISLGGTFESLAEDGLKQLRRPASDREKIIISVQGRDEKKQFRVYMDDKFEKFFKMFAEKFKLDLPNLVFRFDGDKVSPLATPKDLGMEDNDIIEVHVKKT